MVKTLRWAAFGAFLSLPVILYVGRPVNQPCLPGPGIVDSPCDPLRVSPTWLGPVFLTALAVGILLLLMATSLGLHGNHGTSSD
jgi:hypothetical protein